MPLIFFEPFPMLDNFNTFLEVAEDLEVETLVRKRDDHASSDNIPPSTQTGQRIPSFGERSICSESKAWAAFLLTTQQRPARFSFSRILENFFSFSLLVLDLEPFQFHFHFSKKSEGILFFTFHFSKKVKAIRISLLFLEKEEWNQVQGITSPLSLFPIVFPKNVKSHVSISLKILAKFQF